MLGAYAAQIFRHPRRGRVTARHRSGAPDRAALRRRERHPRPPADERTRARQQRAQPVLDELHAWFTATLSRIPGRGDLAAAIRYALSRWQALTRYVVDGCLETDNNAVQPAIRPLTLGRKNWLFAGSDAGGMRAAASATLVGTSKLNGLDPEAYLRQVLGCIAAHQVNRIAELLPWAIPGLAVRLDQPDRA